MVGSLAGRCHRQGREVVWAQVARARGIGGARHFALSTGPRPVKVPVSIERQRLLSAVDAYEEILRQSAGLRNGETDRRREAVQLRRLISERIPEISSLGDAVFTAPDTHVTFRNEFARMRSAVAFHQASWPIVGIEPANPQYQESVRAIREANRRFIDWVRSALSC